MMVLLSSGLVFGQSYDDVLAKFNEGADDINKGEYATAISHLQEVLAMAAIVGNQADDLVSESKKQIPLLNYQVAIGYMKQKDYPNAIPYLEKTVDLATAYENNEEYKTKAMKYLPQLLVGVGLQKLRDENVDEALDNFEQAIKYAPNYAKAYLGKGLVHKLNYEEEDMLEDLTKAIELAKAQNDQKTVSDAQEALGSYFVELGNMEMEDLDEIDPDFTYAVEAYEKAVTYQPSNADAHYKLAVIANRMEDYDKAVKHATAALKSESNEIMIAAINYELGSAYYDKTEFDLACEAFKKAMVDQFEERASRKMEKIPGCE